jgi:hypothetical protein
MEGGHMLNKLHTKSTMKQQDQASKDKSDALLCQAETRKTKSKPIEMHSHVMCLQTIENKTMLMHSNHRPKTNASNNEAKPNNDPGQRNRGKIINPRIFQQSKTEPER